MQSFRQFVRQYGDRAPRAVLPARLDSAAPEWRFATSLYLAYQKAHVMPLPSMLLSLAAGALFGGVTWQSRHAGAPVFSLITTGLAVLALGFSFACAIQATMKIRFALRAYQRYVFLVRTREAAHAAVDSIPAQ